MHFLFLCDILFNKSDDVLFLKIDPGRSRRFVGSWHTQNQHAVSKRSPRVSLRQRLACAHRLQAVPNTEAESVLVDSSAPRRQTLESEQLQYGHDPGVRWRRRHLGAHSIQRHLFSHMGGSLLGESIRLRRVHAMEKAHQCATLGSQPNTQSSLYSVVVAHYQSS